MEGMAPHLRIGQRDVGRYVLLPGDPGRCAPIAALFDDARHVMTNREYTTYTGRLGGVEVSVVSTGIGCPSTAIAVEELSALGADTLIRVGTAGPIQADSVDGELAIVTGAIRDEGTSRQYLPIEFPAVADIEVVNALRAAAVRSRVPFRCGISQSKDSFYGEVETARMPLADTLRARWQAWVAGGAICSEMEAAALFILGSIYRLRTGGVMQLRTGDGTADEAVLLRTAVDALRILIELDAGTGDPL